VRIRIRNTSGHPAIPDPGRRARPRISHTVPPDPATFPCPKCGAGTAFTPGQCPACGHAVDLPRDENAAIQELSLDDLLAKAPATGYGAEGRSLTCERCGAQSRIAAADPSARCPFCGSPIAGAGAADAAVVRPAAILPFALTKEQALERFRAWAAGLWLAPAELKSRPADRIVGVYRPYWMFNAAAHAWYRGQQGEWVYEKEEYDEQENVLENNQWVKRTVRKSREVRRTRWFPTVSGQVSGVYGDVLLFAGRDIGFATTYDLKALRPYDPALIAGWQAEPYTLRPDQAWPKAKEEIDGLITRAVCRDIGGAEQRISSLRTQYLAVNVKHVLLPLFIASYTINGKTYRFQVNGQSGDVAGDRPYSKLKVALVTAAVVAAVILLYVLSYLRG
jgi:Zn finger protein HypA/HybF involved in hydrogenase expression